MARNNPDVIYVTNRGTGYWPGKCAVHPENKDVIYLTASAVPGKSEGGLYKTEDGGKTWSHLIKNGDFKFSKSYIHSFFIRFHPDDPNTLYMSTGTHGLHVSRDGGKTFKHFKSLPFMTVHRVTFDPEDHSIMYVSTFGGGVWKGAAFPKVQ